MKPENLIFKEGLKIIRIDTYYNEYLENKPTCCITCAEDYVDSDDDEWIEDDWHEASFCLNIQQIDEIILKLQEARNFLGKN